MKFNYEFSRDLNFYLLPSITIRVLGGLGTVMIYFIFLKWYFMVRIVKFKGD